MLRILVVTALAVTPLALPTAQATAAVPAHTLVVSGPGDVGMYPAYHSTIRRYAATTTDATFPGNTTDNRHVADGNVGATVTIAATTSDPGGYVLVDGVRMTGAEQTVTGVHAGQEIAVTYVDTAGREADSVIVLPAGFPTMTQTVDAATPTAGMVGLTLSQFQDNGWPAFNAVVDANGVPVWVESRAADRSPLDLKRQPNGHYSYATEPAAGGQSEPGVQLVELDDQFRQVATHHTALPLTNTDLHDSILRADGSEVLVGYEPNGTPGGSDSTIQELDPSGNVTFSWSSSGLAGETALTGQVDYAHLNSLVVVDDGKNFLVSFRNLSAVLKIARVDHDGFHAGDIVWRLGGRSSDFDFVGDPLGGICAQHTASQLDTWQGVPGQYVMVFDDGSVSGLGGSQCIDQTDRTAPAGERHQSRAIVYRLGGTPGTDGTATPVWTYEPSGWFTWFMGSAQLLPASGNVLVGWASETRALATEVAPDETAVWQLTAQPSSNARTYFSYRATKFDAPDKTPPQVTVTTPAANAVYDAGATATTAYSCSDAGGSVLQTCGDAPPGAALDMSPGRHTLTVAATDGAGNTTTVTRSYTVRPAPAAPTYRPDAVVRVTGGAWIGARAYGGSRHQTATQRHRPGHARSAQVAIVNRGDRAGRCLVSGSRSTRAFRVTYRYLGHDVTRAVERGTWRTPAMAPGNRVVLQVQISSPRRTRPGTTRTVVVSCHSVSAPIRSDSVGVRAVVR